MRINMHMKRYPLMLLIILLNAIIGSAFSNQANNGDTKSAWLQVDTAVAGNWTGQSICQQKNTGCHDELAFYRIYKTKDPLIYRVEGYRILNKDTIDMGPLDFHYNRVNQMLICVNSHIDWRFTIAGNQMDGELWNADKVLVRKVHLKKL